MKYRVKFGYLRPDQLPATAVWKNANQQEHFDRLLESVRCEGFRNPVCWVDPAVRFRWNHVYGGSRVCAAVHLQLPLPVIVSDRAWNPLYDDWEDVKSDEDLRRYFRDPPSLIEWGPDYLYFEGCAQCHLHPAGRGD